MEDSTPERLALMVEDDRTIAMLVRFLLEREGYTVDHCADGRTALERIANGKRPALAILDLMLPYADGYELLAAIRKQPGWEGVPVMMLTAKGAEGNIVRALDAGADDYMVKPFKPDELKARLRRLENRKP